jgi:hypothetical protein
MGASALGLQRVHGLFNVGGKERSVQSQVVPIARLFIRHVSELVEDVISVRAVGARTATTPTSEHVIVNELRNRAVRRGSSMS